VVSASAAAPDQSLFRLKPDRLSSFAETDRADVARRVSNAIEKRVRPAAKSLVDYLSGAYRGQAPEGVGLSQYPGGKDAYAHLVRRSTTLSLTAEEIHKLGLTEMDKLNGLLDLVRQKLDFKGSRDDFLKFLKSDLRFFARTPDEVGERLMAAQNK